VPWKTRSSKETDDLRTLGVETHDESTQCTSARVLAPRSHGEGLRAEASLYPQSPRFDFSNDTGDPSDCTSLRRDIGAVNGGPVRRSVATDSGRASQDQAIRPICTSLDRATHFMTLRPISRASGGGKSLRPMISPVLDDGEQDGRILDRCQRVADIGNNDQVSRPAGP
jgi:hypothetical protein